MSSLKKSRNLIFFFFFFEITFPYLGMRKVERLNKSKNTLYRSLKVDLKYWNRKKKFADFFFHLFIFFFNFGKPDILKILLYQVDQIQASFAPKSRGYLQIMAGKFKTLKNNNGKFPLNFFNDSIKHI